MPAFCGVELAEGLNSAPPERQVEDVAVPEGPDAMAEVEGGAEKD